MAYCHKCKYEVTAECVPRSQKMGFPNCYQSIITHADKIRAMSDEELVELFANDNCGYCRIHDFCFDKGCAINCEDVWLDWLRQEGET